MIDPAATALGTASLVIAAGSSPIQTVVAVPLIELVPVVDRTRIVTLEELVQLAALDIMTLTTLLSTKV